MPVKITARPNGPYLVEGDVGEQDPIIGRVRLGPGAGLRDDRAPSTRGKPLPHSRRRASVLRLAHLGTGDAGLGALGLALTLRFLLGPLLVGLAPALEAVIAAAAQRSPMRTSY